MVALKDVLNGADVNEQQRALSELVTRGGTAAAHQVGDALMESYWPACDALADALVTMDTPAARDALRGALRARRHHIRSAAVKALAATGGPDACAAIQSLANDPSYEVRQDVAEALRLLESGNTRADLVSPG